MHVRVTRPLGFMVGNVHHVVRPAVHPQFLVDEAKNSDGFDLSVEHGVLVVVQPEKAVVPEKKKAVKEEK
jgi:hypothetical protein